MKKGNVYRHYKGGLYTYLGIVVPKAENHGGAALTSHQLTATHTETGKAVEVVRAVFTRAYIADIEEPCVLYKDTKDGRLFIRPVDMFFDYALEEGYPSIKRFKLVEQK